MRNATAECVQTADLQAPQVVIGHARVATEEQGTDPQLEELRAADCDAVCLEHTPSGADRTRPALARLLREIRSGETLVVVQLSRSNTGGWANIRQHKWPIFIVTAIIEQLEAMVYIFAVCATRSTPQRHKTCSHCRYCSPPRSRAHQGVAAHSLSVGILVCTPVVRTLSARFALAARRNRMAPLLRRAPARSSGNVRVGRRSASTGRSMGLAIIRVRSRRTLLCRCKCATKLCASCPRHIDGRRQSTWRPKAPCRRRGSLLAALEPIAQECPFPPPSIAGHARPRSAAGRSMLRLSTRPPSIPFPSRDWMLIFVGSFSPLISAGMPDLFRGKS